MKYKNLCEQGREAQSGQIICLKMKQLISKEVIDAWKSRELNPPYQSSISWSTWIIWQKI